MMSMLSILRFTCDQIPAELKTLVSNGVLVIKIGVPILLIIFGMIDLAKAITSQKEDEIKKGQQTFIKRLISASLVFLVVAIVQLVLGFVSQGSNEGVDCALELISGK